MLLQSFNDIHIKDSTEPVASFSYISRYAYAHSFKVDKNILISQLSVCLSCGLLYTKYTAIPAAAEVIGVT
jgi:hypothetical protein